MSSVERIVQNIVRNASNLYISAWSDGSGNKHTHTPGGVCRFIILVDFVAELNNNLPIALKIIAKCQSHHPLGNQSCIVVKPLLKRQ